MCLVVVTIPFGKINLKPFDKSQICSLPPCPLYDGVFLNVLLYNKLAFANAQGGHLLLHN